MTDTELIETLTQIVETQADLIKRLHFQNKQLLTVSLMDDEVGFVLAKTDSILNEERS